MQNVTPKGSIRVVINLPVNDLNRSIKFFTSLGFSLNQALSNDTAGCLIISDDIYVLLVVEAVFETISKRNIPDTAKHREVVVQLAVDSRQRVDELVNRALAAGGQRANEPNDQGFLYGRSFEDLDGHMWDVFHAATGATS